MSTTFTSMQSEVADDRRPELNRNELLMWMTQQRSPELPCFNMPFTFSIDGPLDAGALRQAFLNVVKRHASLRLVIRESNGSPRRQIMRDLNIELPMVDLSPLSDPDGACKQWIEAQKAIPVPLHERQFNTTVIRLKADRHVWFLNVHHILVDGWSFSRIYRWVDEEYRRLTGSMMPVNGNAAVQPDPKPFAERPGGEKAIARAREFWQKKSAWVPDALHFYGNEVNRRGHREHRISRELTQRHMERLDALSQLPEFAALNVHISRLNVLCTVMFAYLARVTGSRALRIGVPIHFRQPENEAIGLLHVTCPVDVDIEEGETFKSLATKVSDELWKILRHGQAFIDDSVYRGYDVLINYPNVSFPPFADMPTCSRWVHSGYGDGYRSLFLQALDFDQAGCLTLHFDAHESVFDASQHGRAIGHFMRLLDAVLDSPATAVDEVDLLTDDERKQVVVDVNRTAMEVSGDLTLGKLFSDQASRTPRDVALVFGERQLSYSELDDYSNRVATMLGELGVNPNVRVAVCAQRSVELIAAVLGIFKAGGTYVPLDPMNPKERLKFLMEDCAAPVLLAHSKFVERLPANPGRTVMLDELEQRAGEYSSKAVVDRARQSDAAYVIYTSGSTGRPKGVVLSQRVLVNLISWQIRYGTRLKRPRTLQFTPLTFDVSLQETLACWASGGTLVAISDEERRDPEATLRLIREQQVEQLFIIFTPLQQLAEAADRTGIVPTSLREVITAGERVQMTPALVRFFERLPDCTFQNQYGPSETHIVTAYELTGPPKDWPTLPSIGKPVANTQVYILDLYRKPVPLGVVGELYIGGAQVADGYLNRDDLTTERFIPDPFSKASGARLYKTGDLGRFLPDGNIQFLGRMDYQTKIRGYRIELGEIEAALSTHPAVRDCVVVAREDAPGEKRLVAYIVGRSLDGLSSNPVAPSPLDCRAAPDLRQHLLAKLPEPMVPSAFVFLSSLPQTPNGKINRLALPPPPDVRPELDADFVAPQTDLERTIADIWREVLRVDRVGLKDNFFALGGDSLKLVHVHTLLRERLACRLSITDLFAYQTVALLGQRIGR